jgi:hypothetical protein
MEGGEKDLGGLSRDRVVQLITGFFKTKFWTPNVQSALGPAPGRPGCRLPEELITIGRDMAGATS